MKKFRVADIINLKSFPNLEYRFATLGETNEEVKLQRDFLGENPLHYYIDKIEHELIVASNISDIKKYLEAKGRKFDWEIVRAVSNNTSLTLNNMGFFSEFPIEEQLGPTLHEYAFPSALDYSDLHVVGQFVRELLDDSLAVRLATVKEQKIGLLLSGGLDSMSVGYLLSKKRKKVTAFTLKVNESDGDISKSRKIAQHFGIDLVEVKLIPSGKTLSITLKKFDPSRNLLYEKKVEKDIPLEEIVRKSLLISAISMEDNLLCAISMYLIAKAIVAEGIATVFCGEGPNEMLNDYGFDPPMRYGIRNKGHIPFREYLTFGLKTAFIKQHGRGGLPHYAVARMGKIFANYGIRLEAPYFNRDIAKIMTQIPHRISYDSIKQHFIKEMFSGEGLDHFITDTEKSMFQDGAGVRGLFSDYPAKKLNYMHDNLFDNQRSWYRTLTIKLRQNERL